MVSCSFQSIKYILKKYFQVSYLSNPSSYTIFFLQRCVMSITILTFKTTEIDFANKISWGNTSNALLEKKSSVRPIVHSPSVCSLLTKNNTQIFYSKPRYIKIGFPIIYDSAWMADILWLELNGIYMYCE